MRRWLLLALHWAIILNFAFEMVYAGYMVFAVIRPEGVSGPLMSAARDVPFEMMVTRRLYAIEFWIATAGLAIYLALTEIGPRLRRETSRTN
jgi:hypothetical protein